MTVKLVRNGGAAGDLLGFNNLWLELLGGDFEPVNAQFTPGGFGLTNGFPPTVSVFPPGDFVKSANSLPPVDFHVEWENVFSPGNFDPTNVDNAEDFQLLREESDLRFGPSFTGEEVDRAI